MTAPPEILELVERFSENIESYTAGRYNETQLRREFIDPFFKALGWDVDNTAGHAEAYKDVIHEDAIRVGGAVKAPDYCFRIGGTRKFFIEAKKPSIDIAGDAAPAYQLRRYAWSAGLPLSILTDFEALAVYDCRIKPNHTDRASAARIGWILPLKDFIYLSAPHPSHRFFQPSGPGAARPDGRPGRGDACPPPATGRRADGPRANESPATDRCRRPPDRPSGL